MTKTTEEERAGAMGERTIHGRYFILRLVSDADRLAELEQGVRELADRLDEPEHDLLSGADLRALLNPSTSHGTKETP